MRGQWRLAPLVEIAIGVVILLAIGLGVVLALSGCGSDAHFRTARVLYTGVDVADSVVATMVDAECVAGCHEADASCQARCDERADSFEGAARAIEVSRRLVLGAIGALLAAEEEGEDPPDLRERLSCAAASLILVADAMRVAQIDLPVAVEVAINVTLTYGGIARTSVLEMCRGLDEIEPIGQHGETPVPARDAGASVDAGTSAVRDPWQVRSQLAAALDALGGA